MREKDELGKEYRKSVLMEWATGRSAQAWCYPTTKKIPMNPDLAEAFAEILAEECAKRDARLFAADMRRLRERANDKIETFHWGLVGLINRYSKENDSNTPDFILADFMEDCLGAINRLINQRENWYGKKDFPGKPESETGHGSIY